MKPGTGTGQARSYAFWVKPAYYVITDGDALAVWNYQGGAVPDVQVIVVKRADLRDRFDDLYSILNPDAVAAVRKDKIDRLQPVDVSYPRRERPPAPKSLSLIPLRSAVCPAGLDRPGDREPGPPQC